MLAVDMWFDVIGGNDLQQNEDAEDLSGVAPARKHGERKYGGRESRDRRPYVGHEAAEKGESLEEKPVGQPDEVKRYADQRAVNGIDGDLQLKVAGDAAAGVAHGLREERKIAVAREVNEAVAEVLSLQENEKGEDNGEQRGGKRLNHAAGSSIEASGWAANLAYLYGVLRCGTEGLAVGLAGGREGSGRVGDAEFVADFLDLPLRAAVCGVAGAVQCLHFLRDVAAVGRQVVGDSDSQLG